MYTQWPGARAQKKDEKNAAAEHNHALSGRIFEQVVKKKGDRKERRKYSLDTLKWYVEVFYQSDLGEGVKDAHTARADIRKCFKRGTHTV